jgi:hypothetical protein
MFKLVKCALSRRVEWRGYAIAALLLALGMALSGCRPAPEKGGPRVMVDGAAWNGPAVSPEAGEGLRVYITCDGKPLLDLPFGEARSVQILQEDGSENTVAITGDAVYMDHANCENQDCVQMGAVTRENLELRVMGGFIICLPHRGSEEVRDG